MTVGASLYRRLLRAARLHDAQPHLKSLIQKPEPKALTTVEAITELAEDIKTRTNKIYAHAVAQAAEKNKPLPSKESCHRVAYREAADAAWRKQVSPLIQRVYDAIFRGAQYYWPQVDFEQLAKKEFHRAVQEEHTTATTAKKKSHAAHSTTTAASSSSPLHPTPPAAVSSHLTDAFACLRVLNHTASTQPLRLKPEDLELDPSLEWYLKSLKIDRNDSAAVAEAKAQWEQEGVMRPAANLSEGCFLVAHPSMEQTWRQKVILILRHDEEHGSVGVILNAGSPNELVDLTPKPSTAWVDPHAATIEFPEVPIRLGGPVPIVPPDERTSQLFIGAGGATLPTTLVLLHRIPALASLSKQVISGPQPVWSINSKDAFLQSLALLCQLFVQRSQSFRSLLKPAAPSSNTTSSASSSTFPSSFSLPEPPFASNDMVCLTGVCTWKRDQLEQELIEGSWKAMEGSGRHVFLSSPDPDRPSSARLDTVRLGTRLDEQLQHEAVEAASNLGEVESPYRSTVDEFPFEAIWGHAMHVLGGEHRAFARIPPPKEEEQQTEQETQKK